MTLMKNNHSDNWKLHFLQIPLGQQAEKKIATNEIMGDHDGALVLSTYLKVICDNFEEAAEAKMASSSKQIFLVDHGEFGWLLFGWMMGLKFLKTFFFDKLKSRQLHFFENFSISYLGNHSNST